MTNLVRQTGIAAAIPFFREEYRLNWRIHTFPKPYVSLLDGITLGGGVGISVHGGFRVVTENTLLAMPETGIGFFPDVGATWFLPRCPGEIGMYLGLTGARLNGADCRYAGLATHAVPSARLEEIEATLPEKLESGDPHAVVTAALAAVDGDIGTGGLSSLRARIDRCFDGDSVGDIAGRLATEPSGFGAEQLGILASMSPLAVHVAFMQLRRGRGLGIENACGSNTGWRIACWRRMTSLKVCVPCWSTKTSAPVALQRYRFRPAGRDRGRVWLRSQPGILRSTGSGSGHRIRSLPEYGRMPTIGFIGLGHMGLPMARNLIKAGHTVVGFDVSTAAVAALAAAGGHAATSIGKAVAEADHVITMLPEGRHVRAVHMDQGGVFAAAKPEHAADRLLDHRRGDRADGRRRRSRTRLRHGRCAGFRRGRPEPMPARSPSWWAARRPPSRGPADPGGDGQGGDPCRRRRQRPGGQDLQQHDAGRPDDRRSARPWRWAGVWAWRRAAVRHQPAVVRAVLVADQLLPGAGAGAQLARPIAVTSPASPRR